MYEFRKPARTAAPSRSLAGLTEDERCAWEERVAICTIDGHLPEERAKEIAWAQIEAQRSIRPAVQSA